MGNEVIKPKLFYQGKEYYCSLELAMDIIGGKWKTMMIYHLKDGSMRSSALQRSLLGVSNKMFTQTVRELERSGIVKRTVYPVVPPKVDYELTELGQSVLPIILDIALWGVKVGE